MKKMKRLVLSVLLFTFAFISLHDYVMIDVQSETAYSVAHIESEDASEDLTLHIHESIHTLLLDPTAKTQLPTIISLYQELFEPQDFFISQTGAVLQRPPLS